MIDWVAVGAFIGPLIASIGVVAGWFAYLAKQREKRVNEQISAVTDKLDQRIDQLEKSFTLQTAHLDKQDEILSTALQAIARVEGRLAGTNTQGAT